MSTAYLGLGGNLGDRLNYLVGAVRALNTEPGVCVEKISSVYETTPVGVIDQPYFLNLVVQVTTTLSARELLTRCLQIETNFGRVRVERWGPRTLDIDVLWFDGKSMNEPDLTLPHPRMVMRAFVLVPLAEIAPMLLLNGMRIDVLAASMDQSGLRLLGPFDSLTE